MGMEGGFCYLISLYNSLPANKKAPTPYTSVASRPAALGAAPTGCIYPNLPSVCTALTSDFQPFSSTGF